MAESFLILFVGCAVIFGVVFGLVWAGAKIFGAGKPVNRRRLLAIAAAISLVVIACLAVYLANGFSDLPNQQ